jgi:hypothetical protein
VTHARWWATMLVAGAALLGFFLWPSKPTPIPSHSLATAEAVAKRNVVLVAPTRAPSSADQMRSADEFKVCNSEFASAQQAPGSETQYEELAATEALGEHVLKALSTGSSLETRALGAWLAVVHARGKAYSPFADRMQLCSTDLECIKAVSSEALVAVEEASRSQVDEMVRQAVNSSSPTIYAMAVSTCHPVLAVAQSPSCQRITSERWTQLDPGEAGPWLHLLEEANARRDSATANEAFYRASIASSLRTGTESFLGYAEPALSSGFSAADRMRAEWGIYLAQATAGLPPMAAAIQQCTAEAVRDSNRRQTCDAFATLLLDKSSSLIGFHIGVRMAERLQWPAERLSALRQERDALDFAAGGWSLSGQPCESLRSFLDRKIDQSSQGELASIRASIAASGKSFQELAQRGEARRQRSGEPAGTASAASGS